MKLAAALMFALAVGVGLTWAFQGPWNTPPTLTMAFTNKVLVKKEAPKDASGKPAKDEFGDPIEAKEEWVDTFRIGLREAGPAAGVFGLTGLVIVWRIRKASKAAKKA